jgi:hypothetical protein
MRRFAICLLPAALAALGGCGGGTGYAPVSGRVMFNNKPAAGVMVTFQPLAKAAGADAGGVGSFATTDADGRYELEVMSEKPQKGALVGTHRVRIATPPPKGEGGAADADSAAGDGKKKRFTDPIPPRFNVESTLDFDVPAGGTDKADFDLKSP